MVNRNYTSNQDSIPQFPLHLDYKVVVHPSFSWLYRLPQPSGSLDEWLVTMCKPISINRQFLSICLFRQYNTAMYLEARPYSDPLDLGENNTFSRGRQI